MCGWRGRRRLPVPVSLGHPGAPGGSQAPAPAPAHPGHSGRGGPGGWWPPDPSRHTYHPLTHPRVRPHDHPQHRVAPNTPRRLRREPIPHPPQAWNPPHWIEGRPLHAEGGRTALLATPPTPPLIPTGSGGRVAVGRASGRPQQQPRAPRPPSRPRTPGPGSVRPSLVRPPTPNTPGRGGPYGHQPRTPVRTQGSRGAPYLSTSHTTSTIPPVPPVVQCTTTSSTTSVAYSSTRSSGTAGPTWCCPLGHQVSGTSDPLPPCLDVDGAYVCTALAPSCFLIQKLREVSQKGDSIAHLFFPSQISFSLKSFKFSEFGCHWMLIK